MERIPATEIDIRVMDEGSIVVLWPVSELAVDWLASNLDPDAPRWGGGFVVEARYVEDIVNGAVEDGLVFGRFALTPERG